MGSEETGLRNLQAEDNQATADPEDIQCRSVSCTTAGSSAITPSQACPSLHGFCAICCETELDSSQMIVHPDCGHVYCKDCWRRHALETMQRGSFPIRCLCLSCEAALPSVFCMKVLELPEDQLRYLELEYEANIPPSMRFYCPIKKCAKIIREDPQAASPTFCPHCKHKICLRCQTAWHEGQTCKEAKEACIDRPVLDMAHDKHWRRCPSCRQLVEKKGGCNAIRCKCTHEFCYVCGKATSSCDCWSRMTRSQRFWSIMGGTLLCCFCCPCVTTMLMWECCHRE